MPNRRPGRRDRPREVVAGPSGGHRVMKVRAVQSYVNPRYFDGHVVSYVTKGKIFQRIFKKLKDSYELLRISWSAPRIPGMTP